MHFRPLRFMRMVRPGVHPQMTRNRPEEQRDDADHTLDDILADLSNAASVREEYEGLADNWNAPAHTGFELAADGSSAA